jgi:hypothetical protein
MGYFPQIPTFYRSCGGALSPVHHHNSKPLQFHFDGSRRPTHLFAEHFKVCNPFFPQLQKSGFFFSSPKMFPAHTHPFLSSKIPKISPAKPVMAILAAKVQGSLRLYREHLKAAHVQNLKKSAEQQTTRD